MNVPLFLMRFIMAETLMSNYGGLGGVAGGRAIDEGDAFEMAACRQLGDLIKEDHKVGIELWSALANVGWKHDNGDTARYSFRAAGDLVAAIKGEGSYLDWYCSGPYPVVSERVEKAMALEGWRPETVELRGY